MWFQASTGGLGGYDQWMRGLVCTYKNIYVCIGMYVYTSTHVNGHIGYSFLSSENMVTAAMHHASLSQQPLMGIPKLF